jgi:hypothetical protein
MIQNIKVIALQELILVQQQIPTSKQTKFSLVSGLMMVLA